MGTDNSIAIRSCNACQATWRVGDGIPCGLKVRVCEASPPRPYFAEDALLSDDAVDALHAVLDDARAPETLAFDKDECRGFLRAVAHAVTGKRP